MERLDSVKEDFEGVKVHLNNFKASGAKVLEENCTFINVQYIIKSVI